MSASFALRLVAIVAAVAAFSPVAMAASGHEDVAVPAPAEQAESATPGEAGEAASAEKKADETDAHGKSAGEGEHAAAPEGEAAAPPPPSLWPEVPAVETAKQPYVLIRSLRAVQDEVASGSTEAHARQRDLMRDLSREMRDLPVGVWDDVRNARAATYFVLSGGDPAVLKLVLGREKTPYLERRLLKGALAYGEGRFVDALGVMHKMEARKLDPLLAGMVALIQGTLILKKEPLKAVAFFDEARLLSPGTLIEESALRQQILLVAREGELERFDLLASQYSRRFPRSLFAKSFRRQFFAGVARQNFKRASEWISRTETELMKAPPAERVGLYLAIAEEAIKGGNVGIAQFAAGKARDLAQPGSRSLERAMLFEAAALVVTEDFEKGVQALNALDVSKLGTSDRDLRDAALRVATSVGKWPEVAEAPTNEKPPESVGRAESLLTKVDSLLEGVPQ
ncbi:hypothetical protein [Hyphomicrobium sp.]|uniref:hypothetical protein n=1 Tax=Hyphomicrobium sp. TaxID=82 RepID=UPI002E2FA5E7|nr:hypothetical protein [Hyphomicrobium sp.]HEX2841790.1 hypothetical protein [Hyphomicrobium sp.]